MRNGSISTRTMRVLVWVACFGLVAASVAWAQNGAVEVESTNDYGVLATSFDQEAVRGVSDGVGFADNGVYGTTNSTSSSEAGVYGRNTGSGPGVYGYQTTASANGYGVRGYSSSSHGVNGVSGSSATGIFGGWFSGPAGAYVQANDSVGSGLQADCPDAGLTGCWGIDASSGNSTGVVADTERDDRNYGFVTNSNMYVGGSCTGCTTAMIVLNGGDTELVAGDLVAAAGVGRPIPDANEPTIMVSPAGLGTVFGVVKNTLEIEMISKPEVTFVQVEVPDTEGGDPDVIWEPRVEDREVPEHNGVDRPALPGDYVVIIVQGMAQVKASVSESPILAGDRLVSVGTTALSARGMETSDVTLTDVGTALETMHQGQGLIWTWVDPR